MGSKAPIRPPRLAPGSRIALVAPAGPLLEADDLTRAAELCRALGYEPVWATTPATGTAIWPAPTMSGWAISTTPCATPTVDCNLVHPRRLWQPCASWIASTSRPWRSRPRALIGFSDITTILNGAVGRAGVVAFHGPVARAAMPAFSRWHFERVLSCAEPAGRLGRLPAPPDVLVPRQTTGSSP